MNLKRIIKNGAVFGAGGVILAVTAYDASQMQALLAGLTAAGIPFVLELGVDGIKKIIANKESILNWLAEISPSNPDRHAATVAGPVIAATTTLMANEYAHQTNNRYDSTLPLGMNKTGFLASAAIFGLALGVTSVKVLQVGWNLSKKTLARGVGSAAKVVVTATEKTVEQAEMEQKQEREAAEKQIAKLAETTTKLEKEADKSKTDTSVKTNDSSVSDEVRSLVTEGKNLLSKLTGDRSKDKKSKDKSKDKDTDSSKKYKPD